MIDKDLLDEARLGELATRIILYRYRIYTAVAVSLTSLSGVLIGLSFMFYWIELKTLLLAVFATPFAIASVLSTAFSKTFYSLNLELLKRGKALSPRRINLVFVTSYLSPFIALYTIRPLPSWENYAWYIALAVAHTLAYIFYERYVNGLLGLETIRAYKILSALSLATTPIVFYQALIEPAQAGRTAIILFVVISIIASIEEVYGAERML